MSGDERAVTVEALRDQLDDVLDALTHSDLSVGGQWERGLAIFDTLAERLAAVTAERDAIRAVVDAAQSPSHRGRDRC